SLRKDEAVAVFPVWTLGVEAQDAEIQRGDDIRRGSRAPWMTGLRIIDHGDDIAPDRPGFINQLGCAQARV
ncbi:hypothetical protein LZP69_16130, partial [Shewanella sp. AS1]|uniref:hypothetical protein n=1 Tax=Shewanella sp. AS1 TaxID=2907626 RepID=UPI001F179D4D